MTNFVCFPLNCSIKQINKKIIHFFGMLWIQPIMENIFHYRSNVQMLMNKFHFKMKFPFALNECFVSNSFFILQMFMVSLINLIIGGCHSTFNCHRNNWINLFFRIKIQRKNQFIFFWIQLNKIYYIWGLIILIDYWIDWINQVCWTKGEYSIYWINILYWIE